MRGAHDRDAGGTCGQAGLDVLRQDAAEGVPRHGPLPGLDALGKPGEIVT
jgi:hypothetical protein